MGALGQGRWNGDDGLDCLRADELQPHLVRPAAHRSARLSALLIPLLLPQMHERYFYLAEVFLVVAAMVDRRFVVAALGIQVASISTYLGYLRDQPLMPLTVAAVFALAAGVAATWLLVQVLRASARAEALS